MVHVGHVGDLTIKEKAIIKRGLSLIDPVISFDEDEEHLPQAVTGNIWVNLAWLVITFVGSGVESLVGSFLKSIGTESGKKLVDHFWRKAKKDTGRGTPDLLGMAFYPMAIVYEVKPEVIGIITLISTGSPGLGARSKILNLLKEEAARLKKPAYLMAEFDKTKNRWVVQVDDGFEFGVGPMVYDGSSFAVDLDRDQYLRES
jgi:hypothetical protein